MSTMPAMASESSDLATILQAYNDVTDRLKRSHDALTREVYRLSEELAEKNKELQRRERLAALGEMAAGVAHEIRNPLGGIGLYASLLERDLADRPRERDIVRKMITGLRNLESVVSDILAFACDAEPSRQSVSMDQILESVLIQTAPQATARSIEIEVDPALGELELEVDASQIERALINLVFNALDAAGDDGHVWIGSRFERMDGRLVCLVVEDSGPGIAADLMHRVFDPFFTTKHTGTGLGLAIVHRIAETHGGWVRAGRGEHGGAEFAMAVPLAGVSEEFSTQEGVA